MNKYDNMEENKMRFIMNVNDIIEENRLDKKILLPKNGGLKAAAKIFGIDDGTNSVFLARGEDIPKLVEESYFIH